MSLDKLAYDTLEAAEICSLSVSTIKKAVHAGELNPRLVGTKRLFTRAMLEAYLESLPQVRT